MLSQNVEFCGDLIQTFKNCDFYKEILIWHASCSIKLVGHTFICKTQILKIKTSKLIS